uniref:Putative oxidoreductase yrbE n=1 Tax=Aceria tosichella TaxID=561515 RepID=A0A6G1SBC4_9ACAR
MDNGYQRAFDTIRDIDDRYELCESDINLTNNLPAFGSRRINVAVVGIGRMGAIHLYNILREPRANLLYVIDSDKRRLEFLERKYFLKERGIKVLDIEEWDRAMLDQQLEAVLIATPTFTHEHYARTALENRKHVLCEKPLAESPEAVDKLVRLAHSKGLKLICAFQRRYDPSFMRLAEQIKRGDIGDIRIIKTCCRDSPLPPIEYIKISGGIYHDCFVHDLDVIIWYSNELPSEVHAYGHAYRDDYKELNDFDTTVVCMKFKSGLITVTDLSRVGPSGYEQRIEVYGPQGVLKMDEFTRVGWEKHTNVGVTRPGQCFSFASRYIEAYSNEITELFNHIEGHQTAHTIRKGYLQALCKITHAIEHSARSCQPVRLEWTAEELKEALD